MRRTWQCPKCGSRRVGYLETAIGDGGERAKRGRRIGMVQAGSVLGLRLVQAHGEFEAFVCTECGYFEEYVKNPRSIRWEDFVGFRWCQPPGGG